MPSHNSYIRQQLGLLCPGGCCCKPYTMVGGVYHTLLGRFSEVDCSTTKRVVPAPNDTFSESFRLDISKRRPFWHRSLIISTSYQKLPSGIDTIPTTGAVLLWRDIDHGKSAQGCVVHAVVYGCRPIFSTRFPLKALRAHRKNTC